MNLSPPPGIAVAAESVVLASAAATLALELQLPLANDVLPTSLRYLLVLTGERLELRELGPNAPGPVYADFVSGAAFHRRRFGGGRHQPLARTVGLKSGVRPTVLDTTAGLGRDAFVLACLGCTVQMVERSPIIAALLRDGLHRATQDPEIGSLVTTHMRLTVADGREFLSELGNDQRPEVIYLDPMYPRREKSALPGKELRLLRCLAGADDDAPELLVAALAHARRRVVVKRPRRAPSLTGPDPTMQITAPNTRFDIYLLNRDRPTS